MSVFKAKYLTDDQIWSMVKEIEQEHHSVELLLADPNVSGDPDRLAELARNYHDLGQFCLLVKELRQCLFDLKEAEELLGAEQDPDWEVLHNELVANCDKLAGRVYYWFMERGYLNEEIEDEVDLKILQFIDYAGPEYAWRLGINVGLDVEESRRRLEKLLNKGLLERVEGNMLENYHRAKSWTKHMNHTYYRMSREGKLYVRSLKRNTD